MNIVIIHGQNHEGSTCLTAREVADKVTKKSDSRTVLKEFFLPRDFDEPCRGCFTCFQTELNRCPHYKKLQPLEQALLEADLIILASPVYVYHATGQMMSFLDHFGTWWVVHRPRAEMSTKQAVVISTAAGGGMKSTIKDMADSLEMWGIRKVYKLGVGVQAAKPEEISEKIRNGIHKKTEQIAAQVVANADKRGCNARARKWFYLMRLAHKHFPPAEPDYSYWEKRGWHKKKRPWNS
ncbi:MAG: NAD(P)H-dependent oxidoreductase [Eubacterium sp.]|nr:NAD(P)H-dependent oxidoreductase [Eubacterium sp.]